MKQLVYYSMLVGFLGIATSCVEKIDSPTISNEADKVSFIIEDFIPEGKTKSTAHINESEIKFQWSANDMIGIFPDDGYQVRFTIEDGTGSNIAVFDGGSWGLKQGENYYAYYPFNKENFESEEKREQTRYTYEGQTACFADENGVVNLSKYDFMASGASTVDNGNVNFHFKHLGALCRVRFKIPATAWYSCLIIDTEEDIFELSGYYDATDKDADGVVSLCPDCEKKNQFEIHFPINNDFGNYFKASEEVDMYFLMPPVDLTSKTLKVKLVDADSKFYESAMSQKNIEAGNSYGWELDFKSEPEPVIQLGPDTANCYIISKSGSYSFPAVKGNSATPVGEINYVTVLWKTFGTDIVPHYIDLIKNVSYKDNMISFSTAGAFKEGNALIAAKDSDFNILWSWHIWFTDKPKDQMYNNNAGTMMDRNLGATSATPGDVGALGLLYQWGRKDPFMGSSSISRSITALATCDGSGLISWNSIMSTEETGTIEYATAHPTTHIKSNNNNHDWYYSADYSTDNDRWLSTKTIYDPCPAGYHVPDGGLWAKAFGTEGTFPPYDTTNKGLNLGGTEEGIRYLTNTRCWYPSAGYINPDGNISDGANYWSCAIHYNDYLYFNGFGNVEAANWVRSTGQSVRCQKD